MPLGGDPRCILGDAFALPQLPPVSPPPRHPRWGRNRTCCNLGLSNALLPPSLVPFPHWGGSIGPDAAGVLWEPESSSGRRGRTGRLPQKSCWVCVWGGIPPQKGLKGGFHQNAPLLHNIGDFDRLGQNGLGGGMVLRATAPGPRSWTGWSTSVTASGWAAPRWPGSRPRDRANTFGSNFPQQYPDN